MQPVLLDLFTQVLQMRVFLVQLDSIGETVRIIQGVSHVHISILVLLDRLHHSGQLHPNLLHTQEQLVIVLVRLGRKQLQNVVLVIATADRQYGRYIDILC